MSEQVVPQLQEQVAELRKGVAQLPQLQEQVAELRKVVAQLPQLQEQVAELRKLNVAQLQEQLQEQLAEMRRKSNETSQLKDRVAEILAQSKKVSEITPSQMQLQDRVAEILAQCKKVSEITPSQMQDRPASGIAEQLISSYLSGNSSRIAELKKMNEREQVLALVEMQAVDSAREAAEQILQKKKTK